VEKNENIRHAIHSTAVYQPVFNKQLLAPRYWPVWAGLLLLWLLRWVPWPVRSALAWPLGLLAYWTDGKRRRIARTNLKRCFPDITPQRLRRTLRQHFYYKIRMALDLGILCWGSERRLRRLVCMRGEAHIRRHLEAGTAVIWLTCHMLALEHGALRISLDYSGVGLVKAAKNPLADWVLQRMRTRFNAILYTREHGLRPVIKAVRQRIMFYYLPDEDLGGPDSVFVPFFAATASTLSTLGRLSRLCKARVTPSVAYYEPGSGKYVMHFFPALEDFPTGDSRRDARRMNQELEKLIAMQLPQYMWSMKLFKHQPGGVEPPY